VIGAAVGGGQHIDAAVTAIKASAMDTGKRPEWDGVHTGLIRPDGHIGWIGADPTAHTSTTLTNTLATWLDIQSP